MAREKSESSLTRRLLRGNSKCSNNYTQSDKKKDACLKESQTEEVSNSSSSSVSMSEGGDSDVVARPQSQPKLFLPCESSDPNPKTKIDPIAQRRKNQIEFWKKCVMNRAVCFGPRHLRTAEALMELGNAELAAQDFAGAGKTFLSALKIFQGIYGDKHLAVARALDKIGLVASMSHSSLDVALNLLTDSWKIRCALLGSDHIDSVDSLNHIAGVCLKRKDFAIAARHYKVVMALRQQIFGGLNHASVAVSAYNLACILDDRLEKCNEAHIYFNLTKHIYESLGLLKSPYYVNACARLEKHPTLLEL